MVDDNYVPSEGQPSAACPMHMSTREAKYFELTWGGVVHAYPPTEILALGTLLSYTLQYYNTAFVRADLYWPVSCVSLHGTVALCFLLPLCDSPHSTLQYRVVLLQYTEADENTDRYDKRYRVTTPEGTCLGICKSALCGTT